MAHTRDPNAYMERRQIGTERELVTGALRYVNEANEIGAKTLETLGCQDETLRGTEDTLEANEYILQRALKTLRGMTWGGMVYNMFTADPSRSVVTAGAGGSLMVGNLASSNRSLSGAFQQQLPVNLAQRSSVVNSSVVGTDDEDLDKLLQAVTGLHEMSLTMAAHIGDQGKLLDRIEEKANRVDDQTLAVTLKTSQLIQSSSIKRSEGYVGQFQFVEPSSGCFLSVSSELSITLVERADRSAFFEVYRRGDNLYGVKNSKTLTFLGTTIWGIVRAGSPNFGKREECHIKLVDVSEEETGIFFLAANWGAGGWLKMTKTVLKTKTGGKIEANSCSNDALYEPFCLQSMTSSVTDKKDWLLLRYVPVPACDSGDRI